MESNGKFTFIHLDGCHTPIKYNEDWEEVWNYDTDTAIKLNFEIIFDYIDEMKALGESVNLDIRTMHEDIFNSMHRI